PTFTFTAAPTYFNVAGSFPIAQYFAVFKMSQSTFQTTGAVLQNDSAYSGAYAGRMMCFEPNSSDQHWNCDLGETRQNGVVLPTVASPTNGSVAVGVFSNITQFLIMSHAPDNTPGVSRTYYVNHRDGTYGENMEVGEILAYSHV